MGGREGATNCNWCRGTGALVVVVINTKHNTCAGREHLGYDVSHVKLLCTFLCYEQCVQVLCVLASQSR
jgi:hypothetical protein